MLRIDKLRSGLSRAKSRGVWTIEWTVFFITVFTVLLEERSKSLNVLFLEGGENARSFESGRFELSSGTMIGDRNSGESGSDTSLMGSSKSEKLDSEGVGAFMALIRMSITDDCF